MNRARTYRIPQSPDLNPLDFYFWGHLKSIVFNATKQCGQSARKDAKGCETIRRIPGIFERVRNSMLRRAVACVDVRDGHFKHFL